MKSFPIPVVALGAGSQPEEEALEYLAMPQGMQTFAMPSVPEEAPASLRFQAAEVLERLVQQMRTYRFGDPAYPRMDITRLDPQVTRLVNDALGQGEVSALAHVPRPLRVQETAFAGVWRVQYPRADGTLEHDYLEACAMPAAVIEVARAHGVKRPAATAVPDGVMNAPALLHEIVDVAAAYRPGAQAHIINLTLLPMSPADLEYLAQALGAGSVAILSRGYGNCRISSTQIPDVWWVQYFNSMEQLILNTIEVVEVPDVALAAAEDFADSIERLQEWLLALREE